MTRVRKGSDCCHRAVNRHIPEFGIVQSIFSSGAQAFARHSRPAYFVKKNTSAKTGSAAAFQLLR